MNTLQLLQPHIHAGMPYPAGYLINPDAAGMSQVDAESLVRQGRAKWLVPKPIKNPSEKPSLQPQAEETQS